ncbi:hypothetical protein HKX48_007071, partial [Thoreauomyces humboldtii]
MAESGGLSVPRAVFRAALIPQHESSDELLELGLPRRGRMPHSPLNPLEDDTTRPPSSPPLGSRDPSPSAPSPREPLVRGLFQKIKDEISLDLAKICTKAVLAYFISSLLVLVRPLAEAFGTTVYLAPIAVLLFPPVKPFGAVLETVLMGTLGLLMGAAVAALGLEMSKLYAISNPDQYAAGCALIQISFLIVAAFFLGAVRASFPRLYAATVLAGLMLAFPLLQKVTDATVVGTIILAVLKPLAAGAVICVAVDLFLWPTFSGTVLRCSIKQTVIQTKELLELVVNAFLLNGMDNEHPIPLETILKKQAQVRASIAKTKAARRESHYELAYDRHSPDDYKLLVSPLQEMMKYLSGMVACIKLEKELVEMKTESDGDAAAAMAQTKKDMLRAMQDAHDGPLQSPLSAARAMDDRNGTHLRTVKSLNEFSVRSLRSIKAASMDLQAEIAEGHHVQISGREITGGMFGGSKRLLTQFVSALRPTTRDLLQACIACMDGGDAHMLRVENDIAKGGPTGLIGGAFRKIRRGLGSQTGNVVSHDTFVADTLLDPVPTTKEKLRTVIKTFEEAEWSAMKSVSSASDPHDAFPGTSARADKTTESPHWNASNLFREEYFLASFFVFNLKECAVKCTKFQQGVDVLLQKRESKRRFWIPRMGFRKWLKGGVPVVETESAESPDIPLYTEGKETFLAPGRDRALSMAGISMAYGVDQVEGDMGAGHGTNQRIGMLIVISPTVGTSNSIGFYRILGTISGALTGYVTWLMDPANPYVIGVMGCIFAYPCFWLFLRTPHARLGTAALVTFTVVTMSTYTSYENNLITDTILILALKRTMCIALGVLAAVIATSYIWPVVARTALRKGLSQNLYLISVLYSHLAALVAEIPEKNPSHYTRAKQHRSRVQIRRLEATLNKSVTAHLELLDLTRNEPRLKGPFPYAVFRDVIEVEQNLVERLGNIRRIVDGEYADVRPGGPVAEHSITAGFGDFVTEHIISPVEKYRLDM